MESVQDPDVPQGNNVSYIYNKDIVRSKVNNKTGVVAEVADDSEFGTHDDPIPANQVRIIWMDKSETIENTNDIGVVGRPFLHGNYVASASDPTGQVGQVVDVNLYVDLLSHDGCTTANVSSRGLIRVADFPIGDYVVLDSWLGRVEDVYHDVTVLFDDGSLREMINADESDLKPVGKELMRDRHLFYFSGQRVKAMSPIVKEISSCLPSPLEEYYKKGGRANTLKGTVTKVTVSFVVVRWITSAKCDSDFSEIPSANQLPKDLKLLSPLAHANWRLGDWCLHNSQCSEPSNLSDKNLAIPLHLILPKRLSKYLPRDHILIPPLNHVNVEDSTDPADHSSNSKSLPVSKETTHANWPLDPKRMREIVIMRDEKPQRALLIMNIKTEVDVLWQDGTIEQGRESTSLILEDYEMMPEQYVRKKVIGEDEIPDEVRPGVVKSVNAKDKTACVRWIKPNQRAEGPRQFDKEEVVGIYELERHPDYDHCYGDVVVRLPPPSMESHMLSSAIEDSKQLVDDSKLKQDEQLYHDHEETDEIGFISDLSWVGIVTGLQDGSIEVTWADRKISTVDPHAINVVECSCEMLTNGSEVGSDAAIWGPYEGDETDTSQNDREDFNQSTDSPDEPFSRDSDGTVNSTNLLKEEQNRELTDLLEVAETLPSINSEKPHTSQFESRRYDFKGFDITNKPLSHHFIKESGQSSTKWSKRVQRDFKILQNDLPDGIYVRVYEKRMDLIRAVIVGAYGTPYQDGLFLFDFHLPAAYPEAPPSAYYHSRGLKINPNLYDDGKVCLSLLNTWSGKDNEVWVPSSSSILQVLVSLQGIVLNSEPYFNEAGYDKKIGSAEGEKKSLSYNEATFLLNCQTMMYLMRDPPKDFENLVKEHFSKRGHYILKACDAYIEGHLIGTLTEDAAIRSHDNSNSNSNSAGFKLALKKIVPKLIVALSKIGADCEAFRHLQQVQPDI